MKQHKWHKEIKAWADGAEIEYRENRFPKDEWLDSTDPYWNCDEAIFRIKPQPIQTFKAPTEPTHVKKPQYLYVYLDDNYELSTIPLDNDDWAYIGRIKLEVDDCHL